MKYHKNPKLIILVVFQVLTDVIIMIAISIKNNKIGRLNTDVITFITYSICKLVGINNSLKKFNNTEKKVSRR